MNNNGSGTMDLNAMAARVSSWVEELKTLKVRSTEIEEIKTLLQSGRIGEAYIRAGALRAVAYELKPDALVRKMMDISQRGERCLFDLLEVSRLLTDVMVWKHYLQAGYEDFDSFCGAVLRLAPKKAYAIAALKDRLSLTPGELTAGDALDLISRAGEALHKFSGAEQDPAEFKLRKEG